MFTYRLILAYDGADFHGWQVQPSQRTVQGELERVLARVTGQELKVAGAGRTDAGVHALGQCASFASSRELDSYRLMGSLRALLPEDISPLLLERVPDSFNARFSATARFYTYRLALRPCAPLRGLHWRLKHELNFDAMRRALLLMRDAVDFEGFCTREAAAKGTICHLRRLELQLAGDEIHFHIGADRFLHNMVRIVTGTIVEIGRGRWRPERMTEILESGDRTLAGPTAPPQGLFFRRVEYPAASLALDAETE